MEESIQKESHVRDGKWTESVAVGSEAFVRATREKLAYRAEGREVIGVNGSYELRESLTPYKGILGDENVVLRPQNEYFLEDSSDIST
jgi:putative transposase